MRERDKWGGGGSTNVVPMPASPFKEKTWIRHYRGWKFLAGFDNKHLKMREEIRGLHGVHTFSTNRFPLKLSKMQFMNELSKWNVISGGFVPAKT